MSEKLIKYDQLDRLPESFQVVDYTMNNNSIMARLSTGEIVEVPIVDIADQNNDSLSQVIEDYIGEGRMDHLVLCRELEQMIKYIRDNQIEMNEPDYNEPEFEHEL